MGAKCFRGRGAAPRSQVRYVLDASVAVAALRKTEPSHRAALQHCLPLFSGRNKIVVPAIFDVEVISALARRGMLVARVAQFFDQHFFGRTLVTLGPRAVRSARAFIGVTRRSSGKSAVEYALTDADI